METQAYPLNSKYWLWFAIWLVIITIMLLDVGDSRKYFWLALPGTCTYFTKAMNLM